MKAGELVAGDVIEILGERLTVTGPARVERNTAVIDTASATEGVTLYLRAAGNVALVRPSPTRRPAERWEVPSPEGLAAAPRDGRAGPPSQPGALTRAADGAGER